MTQSLPEDVQAAAKRGDKIGAIRLLRQRTGLGLADAKAAVDALALPSRTVTPQLTELPPDVKAALLSGNTIEAIKLLRNATGLGLKEAKDTIDAYKEANDAAFAKLHSGEVPRSRFGFVWFLVVLITAAVSAWVMIRN